MIVSKENSMHRRQIQGAVSGRVLLSGSEAGRLSSSLLERYPQVNIAVVSLRDFAQVTCRDFAILCPADEAELQQMTIDLPSPGSVQPYLTVLAPSELEIHADEPLIILRECSTAFDILMNMPNLGLPMTGQTPVSDLLSLARSGVLLPFFFHNINNILTRILGNVELAGFDLEDRDKLKRRLNNALEGAEELREFLSDLSLLAHGSGQSSIEWTPGHTQEIYEIGRMSSGTSVEFTHLSDPDLPDYLPVSRNSLNSLLGALSGAATLFVNGCGSVHLDSKSTGSTVQFILEWHSTSGSGTRSAHQNNSALILLAWTAMLSPPAGVTFVLDEWSEDKGRAMLIVNADSAHGGME